jgi:mannose-6-phosphate isomerase-like protein (cupin superfamily)
MPATNADRTPCEADILAISAADSIYGERVEDGSRDAYLNGFIVKPWGHEYRVYCDHLFDVWRLRLEPGQSTSMHCHMKKDTVLLCLGGAGKTTFLDGTAVALRRHQYIYIHRGAFHRTEAETSEGLDLIEVENPRNKFDLVRLNDNYGRARAGYEPSAASHELLEPMKAIGRHTSFRSCDLDRSHRIKVARLTDADLEDGVIQFIILADIHHHLAGRIAVHRPGDPALADHLGSLAIRIESTQLAAQGIDR